MKAPIVKGGCGRSANSLVSDAGNFGFCILLAVAAIVIGMIAG